MRPPAHTRDPSSKHPASAGPAAHTGNGNCGVMSSSGSAMRPDWFASTTELRGTTDDTSSIWKGIVCVCVGGEAVSGNASLVADRTESVAGERGGGKGGRSLAGPNG
eukprot:352428-Chlamydomonas_euryale.AAC.16